MSLLSKLEEITDENRYEMLDQLTPQDLKSAGMDGWAGVFDHLLKLKNDTIEDKRKNRELMRKIYPHYDLPYAKKQQEEKEVQDLFTQLSKSPVFKTAACRWEQTPPAERASLIGPVVVKTAEIMNLSQTRLESYEDAEGGLGYVMKGENGSRIFHLNKHPKVFENMPFSEVMDTLCHELTHLRQHDEADKISSDLKDGESLEVIARLTSSLAPHFKAPYFSYKPKNLNQLQANGYQWDSHQDYVAYTSHPSEKEAWFRGSKMGALVKTAMDNGYGKGLMPNPYHSVSEKEIDPGSVHLGGFTEDTDPEKHLAAGTALLQKAIKKQVWGQTLKETVRDGFGHYAACLKHGEYLTPSPAVEMLSLVAYYARQKTVMDTLNQSGCKQILADILERSKKSQNPAITQKARITAYLIKHVPTEQYQNKPKEQQSRPTNSELLGGASNMGQGQGGEDPMDKHNGLDYRDVDGKDRKPEIPVPNRPTQSQENDAVRRRAEEIRRQLGWNDQLAAKRGHSL